MRNFTISDDSEFEAGRCSNGGHYGFWQTYRWSAGEDGEPGHYDRQFYTTHEFGLCPSCGGLCQSPQDYDNHSTCTSQVSVEEVLHDLLSAVSRLGEKAAHFDGPAIRITVSE